MKKIRKRVCTICKKEKLTTNTDNPFCCEDCLRSDGRQLLLGEGSGSMILVFFFGVVIGVILVKLIEIFL